jgi:hypothetical protein
MIEEALSLPAKAEETGNRFVSKKVKAIYLLRPLNNEDFIPNTFLNKEG